jgi:hypothetical protein
MNTNVDIGLGDAEYKSFGDKYSRIGVAGCLISKPASAIYEGAQPITSSSSAYGGYPELDSRSLLESAHLY